MRKLKIRLLVWWLNFKFYRKYKAKPRDVWGS